MAESSRELEIVREVAEGCQECRLSSTRRSVVFASGSPLASIFIVGEAPGHDEDAAGVPFVGRSGKLLDRLIEDELNLERTSCYVANVVKCRPPENRNPMPDEVASCRHFLDSQLRLVGPRVVITLGNFAMRALLSTGEGITSCHGRAYPLGDATVIPTFHPAAALRGGAAVLDAMRADFRCARAVAEAGAA
jgi:DNA polymerase